MVSHIKMATPLRHFENWKNSCAIDSFLEIAQFTFYHDLHTTKKGEFLTHIYNACRSRECDVELPLKMVREPSWQWLQSNASTFAGCTDGASFEQILDFISTNQDEERLFTTIANWHYVCASCNAEKVEQKQNLPLYISNDNILADCNYDLELTINSLLYRPEGRVKTCLECNKKTRLLSSAHVQPSKYLFVRIPTLVENFNVPKVLNGIKVKEDILLGGEHMYHLCGALKGTGRHFSVTVAYGDEYCHIDDVSLNVRTAKSLSMLTGQGETVYETDEDDGYFLFIFKSVGSSSSFSTPVKQCAEDNSVTATNSYTHTPQKMRKISLTSSPNTHSKLSPLLQNKQGKVDFFRHTMDTTISPIKHVPSTLSDNDVDSSTETNIMHAYSCGVSNSFDILQDEVNCSTPNSYAGSDDKNNNSSPHSHADKLQTPQKNVGFKTPPRLSSTMAPEKQIKKENKETSIFSTEQPSSSHCNTNSVDSTASSLHTNASHITDSCRSFTSSTLINGKKWTVISPVIEQIQGRPFVSLEYLLAALSTENKTMNLSRLKLKNTQLNLDNSKEFYPVQTPKYVSLKAFIYNILKSGRTYSAKKVQAHLFSLIQNKFQASNSFAGREVITNLDENGGIFMKIEDCYSLCNIHGVNKRHRYFERAAKFLGLSPETQFVSQPPANRRTHINMQTIIGYLFIRIGSKRYREVTSDVEGALNSLICELVHSVTELPPIYSDNHISDKLPVLGEVTCDKNNSNGGKVCSSSQEPTLEPPAQSPPATSSLCNKTTESSKCSIIQYNGTMSRRATKQQESFSNISHEIFKGGKEKFKDGLSYSIQHFPGDEFVNSNDCNWSGKLSCKDLIDILDRVNYSKSETSFLGNYIQERASELYHIDARSMVNMVDSYNSQNVLNNMRKFLPGFLSTRREIEKERSRLEEEFRVILKPTKTVTGYRIDPGRLLKCLHHLYYFIPKDNQLWKIWGDARETGGKKCCNVTLSPLNNEIRLHNIKFHSPKDIWPISLFYGGDGRWNLEGNIGGEAGQPGWLNDWIKSEQKSETCKFFLTGDSMFLDAVHGKHGELAPNSKTGFNLYSMDSIDDKHVTGSNTGFRSELIKDIDRTVPNSLLPSIPLSRTVFCLDHATTRIVEKLVQLRTKSIAFTGHSLDNARTSKQDIDTRLGQFKRNMINRMVFKAERLAINPDGSLTEKLTLNKRDAHALLLEPNPEYGIHGPLLEGVALTTYMFNIDQPTQTALQWPPQVSEYDLETAMWNHLSRAVFMLRNSDPDPVLKTGCQFNSLNADDYFWGLHDAHVQALINHLDIFHKLFVTRYSGKDLTPYMLKLIDFTSVFLRTLPVKSLMRFSTEGGEHLHYEDNCYFFQHTQRGGSYRTRDPLYSILLHRYRILQYRLLEYSKDECKEKADAGREFLDWVKHEVLSSDNQNPEEVKPACEKTDPQPPPAYSFILVGKVPASVMKALTCKTKGAVSDLLQKHNSRVVDVSPSHLPKCYESVRFVVLATQAQCECSKPPAILDLACRRKWPIVSYLFCPEYISNPFTTIDNFLLDLTVLNGRCRNKNHEEAKGGKDYFFKERGPIHPVTLYKKQSKIPKQKVSAKPLKGPGSGYARFVEQEIKQVKSINPGATWKEINREIAGRWKHLDEFTREKWNSHAKLIFERHKNEDSK